MMKTLFVLFFLMIGTLLGVTAPKQEINEKEKLMVIWSSGDRDVALKVFLMYPHAAKKDESVKMYI